MLSRLAADVPAPLSPCEAPVLSSFVLMRGPLNSNVVGGDDGGGASEVSFFSFLDLPCVHERGTTTSQGRTSRPARFVRAPSLPKPKPYSVTTHLER